MFHFFICWSSPKLWIIPGWISFSWVYYSFIVRYAVHMPWLENILSLRYFLQSCMIILYTTNIIRNSKVQFPGVQWVKNNKFYLNTCMHLRFVFPPWARERPFCCRHEITNAPLPRKHSVTVTWPKMAASIVLRWQLVIRNVRVSPTPSPIGIYLGVGHNRLVDGLRSWNKAVWHPMGVHQV